MTDDVVVGGEIPTRVRQEIHERDQYFCRLCGVNAELSGVEIHHVYYGGDAVGIGGARVHNPDHMVSLCRACHVRAHGQKFKYQAALIYVACHPGITALQVLRWSRRGSKNNLIGRGY